jgi:hypothetical protein
MEGRTEFLLYLCLVPLLFSLLSGPVMACSSILLSSLWLCVYRELQALYLAGDGLFLYPSLFSLAVCLPGASGPLPGR